RIEQFEDDAALEAWSDLGRRRNDEPGSPQARPAFHKRHDVGRQINVLERYSEGEVSWLKHKVAAAWHEQLRLPVKTYMRTSTPVGYVNGFYRRTPEDTKPVT